MQLQVETHRIQAYLRCTDSINFDHTSVKKLAGELAAKKADDVDIAKTMYEYVRDQIAHSGDIVASMVTCTASDVLTAGHGICCSKSHLLAALLRASGIPAGICYQKLRTDEDDPKSDLILHCLNAVYLHSFDKWICVDTHGNKTGIDAQFSVDNEQLAWPVRRKFGEGEDPTIYANPWPAVVQALRMSNTRTELYSALQTLWTPQINTRFQ